MTQSEIIKALYKAGFILGGSRKMAIKFPDDIKITDETDYDFYSQYTKINHEFLIGLGFYACEESIVYFDNNLEMMYKHYGHNVEALLRKDAEMYTRVFDIISVDLYKTYLWKSSETLTEGMSIDRHRDAIGYLFNALFELDDCINQKSSAYLTDGYEGDLDSNPF